MGRPRRLGSSAARRVQARPFCRCRPLEYPHETVKLRENAKFDTLCIHAGQVPDPSTGAIITPIYQTSTYVQDALGQHKGYEYARTQNPTRAALEGNLAAIEKAATPAFAFASGMAATGAVMTLLQSGDHVVVTDNTYGGTYRLFERVLRKYQLDFTYVDTSDVDAHRRGDSAGDEDAVPRDADQSRAAADRPGRGVRGGARARGDRGRRQHVRQSLRAAAARLRRRHRRAQHDQVSSTATATASVASSWPCATSTSSGCASSRTPRARSSGRWMRGWCCAAPRRCRFAWSGTTPTRRCWRSSSPRIRR